MLELNEGEIGEVRRLASVTEGEVGMDPVVDDSIRTAAFVQQFSFPVHITKGHSQARMPRIQRREGAKAQFSTTTRLTLGGAKAPKSQNFPKIIRVPPYAQIGTSDFGRGARGPWPPCPPVYGPGYSPFRPDSHCAVHKPPKDGNGWLTSPRPPRSHRSALQRFAAVRGAEGDACSSPQSARSP